MTRLMLSLIAGLVALMVAQIAGAEPTCVPRAPGEAYLTEDLGMREVSAVITSPRTWLQTWCNAQTGEWMQVTNDGRVICPVAAGRDGCYGLRKPPNT